MKTFFTVLITVVVMVVLLGGAGLVLRKRAGLAEQAATAVRLERPTVGDLTEFITAPGTLKPINKVALSARISARIVDLPFEEGEEVTRGDPAGDPPVEPSVLVRLDAKDLEAQLTSAQARFAAQQKQLQVQQEQVLAAEANVAQIQTSLAKARRDLQRHQQLLTTQDVSASSVEDLESETTRLEAQLEAAGHGLLADRAAIEVSRHNIEAAEAEIERARDALSYTVISSPLDGVVTRVNAEVGELVMTGTMNNPGTVILEVADLSQMLVVAEVNENNIAEVKPGLPARVHMQAWPEETFDGVVRTVALTPHPASTTTTRYYEAEILLADSEKPLLVGMTADVDIEIRRHEGVVKAPSQAILARQVDELPADIRQDNPHINRDKTFATVVYRMVDGRAVVTPVTIGASDVRETIIESGIGPDDLIVTGPYSVLENLKHDQRIRDEKGADGGGSDSQVSEPNAQSSEGGAGARVPVRS